LPCLQPSCCSGTFAGLATGLAARGLAASLRSYRASPRWWQALVRWPFAAWSWVLRRWLGRRLLLACEVAIE
jgi:hypothetical protein